MMKKNPRNYEKGQSSVLFALLIPLFVVGMVFAVDFGRFLVMQNQAQIFADGAALAAASALDVSEFTSSREVTINRRWAEDRAGQIIADGVAMDPDLGEMNFSITHLEISGNEVFVQVSASCATMWSKPFGVGGYSTVAVSSARAATGISKEMN